MMKKIKDYSSGLIFVFGISLLSIFLNDLIKDYINLEALTIAIIIGMIYNNTVGTQKGLKSGVQYSLKTLLKIGIVLLGFKMDIYMILELGPKILSMVLCYVPLTLAGAILLGRILKINKKLSVLIGVGSSICGASAVVAIAPSIEAEEEDAVIAVSVVSLLGAIGVMIYSGVAATGPNLTPIQFGAWSGLSLHGVAHALAAAFALGDKSGEIGTFVKMARVLMLVPVTVVLSWLFRSKNSDNKKAKFPMYVLYFILAGVVNSLGLIPLSVTNILMQGSSLLILMSMTAMGLMVNLKNIIKKGTKALMLGIILFAVFSSISLGIIANSL